MLRQQLANLQKLPEESVTVYLARARSIMTDLKSIGSSIQEAEVALAVLSGLPTEYGVVVEVLQYSDSLSFDVMLPKLLHAEQLAKEKFEKEKVMSIKVFGAQARPTRKCFYCGRPGHVKAQCKRRHEDQKISQRGFPGQTVVF